MIQAIRTFKLTLKEYGIRGTFKRYGWKLFAAIFCYYLVRDTILYILLPWYVASRFLVTP